METEGVVGKIEPKPVVDIRFRPRMGFVVVRRIREDEGGIVDSGGTKMTKQGVYLASGNHLGHFFWEMIVVEAGPGAVLECPGGTPSTGNNTPIFNGTDDLEPGMRVYVKAGERRAVDSTGVRTQEMRSILQLNIPGDEDLFLVNFQDIFGEIIVKN